MDVLLRLSSNLEAVTASSRAPNTAAGGSVHDPSRFPRACSGLHVRSMAPLTSANASGTACQPSQARRAPGNLGAPDRRAPPEHILQPEILSDLPAGRNPDVSPQLSEAYLRRSSRSPIQAATSASTASRSAPGAAAMASMSW